jgi:gamma-glutamyltranspeptidase/glutathione hydrolase
MNLKSVPSNNSPTQVPSVSMRDFEAPGRSMAMAKNAMVATSHTSASLAAIEVLRAGGNAMDAAVAACAVQCVVEPGSTGIGGDCFALYAKGGRSDGIVAFDGAGWSPAAASVQAMRDKGLTEIERHSPHAVTVPGAIDAWATLLKDHGRMSLAEVLQPAIQLADEGYAVTPRAARDWATQLPLLQADKNAARVMLSNGQAPAAGSVHQQRELAATLKAIARDGRDAFYRGPIAEEMVACLRGAGGFHTEADFAEYRGRYVTPIKNAFRGHDIHECPPSGQGVIALLILNILSGFEASGDPSGVERLYLEIEATRLAYAVRDAVLADPSQSEVDVARLLSPEFAAELRARIDPKQANKDLLPPNFPEHRDTVYLTVVDKDRNCVSFINSLFALFGSGLMTPTTGVMFHNRGQSFSMQEGHPNALAPRKRPMHTIIPGMASRDGKVVMTFGVMGGHYQAMGHAHFLSKVLDYGMDMQSASDLPRVFPLPGKMVIEAEHTVPAATLEELARRGFSFTPKTRPIGGAQAIWIDWEQGVLHGASDHRKDGCALGL